MLCFASHWIWRKYWHRVAKTKTNVSDYAIAVENHQTIHLTIIIPMSKRQDHNSTLRSHLAAQIGLQ